MSFIFHLAAGFVGGVCAVSVCNDNKRAKKARFLLEEKLALAEVTPRITSQEHMEQLREAFQSLDFSASDCKRYSQRYSKVAQDVFKAHIGNH